MDGHHHDDGHGSELSSVNRAFIVGIVLNMAFVVVIVVSTWSLLTDSLRLSLDGVPPNVDLAQIKTKVLALPGVANFHHIHV